MQNYLLLKMKNKQNYLATVCFATEIGIDIVIVIVIETGKRNANLYTTTTCITHTYLRIFVTTSVCSLQVKDYKC